jgi:hypothetical protein
MMSLNGNEVISEKEEEYQRGLREQARRKGIIRE